MRLGVSMKSAHSFPDPRKGASVMVGRAIAAQEAGLDSLFLGDHHSVGYGYYQNVPMLGRLLAEWPRTAGALFLLPLWHPLLLAEQVATLAAIARGRFVLQSALGAGDQVTAMGVDPASRVARFEAGLHIIRQLLAGAEVSEEDPYRVEKARISPLPIEPIEIWIGGHARAAIDRTARMGDGWIIGPDLPFEDWSPLIDHYRERCEHHGRPIGQVVVRRDVHVGRDQADAERVVGPIITSGYRGFDPAVLVYGGVEEVSERCQEIAAAGVDELLIRHIGGDEPDVLASFERLGGVRELLSPR
jgi:alkanesulfonate monooxygenase SsuD/methylene tetrahydromethanopterin reductase-like flavin-dependent oxidoreductase (luciferase family)